CAPAPPLGASVSILGEEAVIVWDAARGLEHFIRRADFRTDAESFGFIVPTPSEPELAEADSGLFARLGSIVRPRVVRRTETSGVTPTCIPYAMMLGARDGAVAGAAPVTVIRHQSVAGYDAVVLAASDADALGRWLAANGYASSAPLTAWAKPYVEQGWMFTAFKVAPSEGDDGVATSPVRMSFATDRPMYPYREPADQREGTGSSARALRVFFIADRRHAGALGDDTVWPGKATFARSLDAATLDGMIDATLLPDKPYLTTFVDESSPRPGTADLFFAPDDAGDLEPDPFVYTDKEPLPIPLELVALVGGGVWWWRRRRKRAVSAS
ncbi:MAG: DUF2330 domain-containing protein, partial [Myxococcota bacterium]